MVSKALRLITIVLAFMFVASTAQTRELPTAKAERLGMSSERLQRVNEMAQAYVDSGKVPGMVTMVARGGKIVHFEAFGQRGVDDPTPLRKDDLFRIYSMTKPITAVAAMQLYEQGKFHLNDPIAKFVPEFAELKVLTAEGDEVPAQRPITMHQLFTHTAGFSYGFPTGHPIDALYREKNLLQSQDLDDFAQRLATLPLTFQPGERWRYSVAVDLMGLIVQRISGIPFDQYLRENIFEPLEMNDTFFEVPEEKLGRFLPNHYFDPKTKSVVPVPEAFAEFARFSDVTLFSGGAGLVSTTMDYMRFAEAMRRGGELDGVRILGAKTVRYMTRDHLPASISANSSGENVQTSQGAGRGFGLGFGVVKDAAKSAVLTSAGEYFWGGAAGTIFWIDPVEEVVAIGMVQLMASPHPLRNDLRVATYQSITEPAAD